MNIHNELTANRDFFKKQVANDIALALEQKLAGNTLELDEPKGFQTEGFIYGNVPPKLKSTEYLSSSVGWVYACVSAIADAIAAIEPKLYKIDKNGDIEEVDNHPILDLLYRVNRFTSRYDHFWQSQQYLELTGESPWFVDRGESGIGDPQNLLLLRPDRLDIVKNEDKKDDNPIAGYIYKQDRGQTMTIKFSELVFLKYPDPVNTFRGKGTLQAAAATYDIDAFSEEFNRRFFYNSARPDSTLTTDQKLTERQRAGLRTEIKRLYQGHENSHKTAILESGLKWEPMTMSQKDMDFLEQQKFSMMKILSIFRVPKPIVAISDDVNLANAKIAEYVFSKWTITPKLMRIYSQLNETLLPMFKNTEGLFLSYDNPTPVDTVSELARFDSGLGKGWMTINEVRQEQNLESVGPDGDVIYLPFSLSPLGSSPAEPTDVTQESIKKMSIKTAGHSRFKSKQDIIKRSGGGYALALKRLRFKTKSKKSKEAAKDKIDAAAKKIDQLVGNMVTKILHDKKEKANLDIANKKEQFAAIFIKSADYYEVKFLKKTNDIFDGQKRKLLKLMPSKALEKANINVDDYLLDEADETQLMVRQYNPLMKDLIKNQGNAAALLIGMDGSFDEATKRVQNYIKKRTFKFSFEINEETNRLLKRELIAGVSAGESIDMLRKRIETLFDDMEKYRSERIARSEVIRASNFAANEMYVQSEVVEQIEWLVTNDDRTCEYCAPLDGKVVGIGKRFFDKGDKVRGSDGGTLVVEYEPIEHPPLHVNCRCALIPVIK